jgi:hypothetical protein
MVSALSQSPLTSRNKCVLTPQSHLPRAGETKQPEHHEYPTRLRRRATPPAVPIQALFDDRAESRPSVLGGRGLPADNLATELDLGRLQVFRENDAAASAPAGSACYQCRADAFTVPSAGDRRRSCPLYVFLCVYELE